MSFTNLHYDEASYDHLLKESLGSLKYQLNTPLEQQQCFVEDSNIIMQKSGVSVDAVNPLIDVDSELLGITRKLSNDPQKKYLPKLDENGNVSLESSKFNYNPCKNITTEHTRLSNPSFNLRGTGWNRWEWLCQNPQDKLEIEFSMNTDTKNMAKDSHRPIIPSPLGSANSLPKEQNGLSNREEVYEFEEVPTYPVSVSWERPVDEPLDYDGWQPKNVLSTEAQVPTGPTSTQWQTQNTIDKY